MNTKFGAFKNNDLDMVAKISEKAKAPEGKKKSVYRGNLRQSSIKYYEPVYLALTSLKINEKVFINKFVNEAIIEKLIKEYPKISKNFSNMLDD